MKHSKIYLILVLLALLVVAAYFLQTQKRREVLKPIFAVDSTAVARIEIQDPQGSLTLSRTDVNWQISSPFVWNVEPESLRRFFADVITESYATTPIASGQKAIEQYGLQENSALQVRVFDESGSLRGEAWFSNPGNPFDYFRFAKGSQVFQIRKKVAFVYAPKFEYWRSPHVLTLMGDQMLSIRVQHPANSYELTRIGSIWRYTDAKEDFDIPAGNTTMGKILNILSRLGSYNVLDEEGKPSPEELGTPACEVAVGQTNGQTVKISFFNWDGNYLMHVDSYPDMYFVVLFDTVFRFTRHAALFRAREGYPPR
ncbi:MAG: DUF4340 domain-containing protein [Candidatus Syntrophosphaera sp.]|nr:DUF4340 domain-containing protein [Candidatus Syntrophosphaera sp.]